MAYQTLEQLQQSKAKLHETVVLDENMQLAFWSNQQDRVSVCSDHHTLSLYIQDGYESYQKTPSGWKNGGGPGRFCLLPEHQESTWDIRGGLKFVHLYYTDQHLRDVAEKIWDKEPNQIELNEVVFNDDERIRALYQFFLLDCDWQDSSNHLQMSTTASLLLNHLIRRYSSVQWQQPIIKGGLAPHKLKYIQEWIEDHLDQALTLSDLANVVNLSEYHFAHMFKQSMNMAPHQYVMQRRLTKAKGLIQSSQLSLQDIALVCGFSSASHLSHRFKQFYGMSPSQLR
ncbi:MULTISPECIES: helix-turn-helix domain-containing protein [Acinetobacter]|uniref:helix-turn-helix domain-containing protein n=1 Tax=Acinetobacter TaxID=469 RepID=UPI0002CFF7A7|nr:MULTISPECIES: helix-turn-helix domain-containing protein [Acinetobacter]ENU47686.1 hypothetical protein F984_01102 [Acinetobacter nosocomialis NIPH 2119]MBD0443505.1 AraC family transcriptional regulator [Acinetobacter nosocomialis]MBR7735094.1 AraC family transcriptional regulator [Acinetobacter nosocomialis]MDC9816752.1 AraC family transcriptional regulator [Acinetobacter nosocomialis]MDE1701634.1 AraC family transcriptional regulator [Acinetobacter nosocomialis]